MDSLRFLASWNDLGFRLVGLLVGSPLRRKPEEKRRLRDSYLYYHLFEGWVYVYGGDSLSIQISACSRISHDHHHYNSQ